jgi:flotillin
MKTPTELLAFIDLPAWIGILFITVAIAVAVVVVVSGVYAMLYRKVKKGTALIRTGFGGTQVNFNGMLVFPVFHRLETMDISLKRIEIDRTARNGLICRADIKVAFFVRVNHAVEDCLRVAQAVGCERASSQDAIRELFDAKFSEALKTVGKRFDFIQLYEDRDKFRDEILKVIGTDLNGFVLDDAAIDYLEQTPIESLDPDNILDSEGIKKITELTATQAKLANHIQRDKEKVIKQQDVEAREAILELERQLAETEAKQQREVESVRAREEAETTKVREEERQKAERARIAAEEEIQVTDGVEIERVKRDQQLESIERERLTSLKDIDKEKAIEIERKAIQDVIKERVAVEKLVVIEQERIKDTEAFAGADRQKQVKVTLAEAQAQEEVIRRVKEAEAVKQAAELAADQRVYEEVKAAEAARKAAELKAEERIVIAEAEQVASEKEATAKKMLAEATTKESAAVGIGEAEVMLAKAEATRKQGSAEAEVQRLKLEAEADGIHKKAEAMKLFEEAGQAHEEFKLNLDKEKAVELAQIHIQKDIAEAQAAVLGEAMKSAKIEIIGGENRFFDQITSAIARGKSVDRLVEHSETLRDVKETFFNGDPEYFKAQLREWASQFGLTANDVQDLSVAAILGKLIVDASGDTRRKLLTFLGAADRFDLADKKAVDVLK